MSAGPRLVARVGWDRPGVAGEPGVAGRPGGGAGAGERALLLVLSVLAPLALALAISVATAQPSVADVVAALGITLGVIAVLALMLSRRYTVTLALLLLYLGLLDGPVKLESASGLASGIRDVLILAIAAGMLMRMSLGHERVRLPPLCGWVLAFVAVVLVQALNPHTGGVLKVIGGYRQQLEFVPLFFFGYLIMRSKQRLRALFLLLGVIALANGVVGAYQSRLSPGQLASWGPGYGERVKGNGVGQTGRTYSVEGVAHPRPPALGSDSGFGGGVGVLALPGLLALLTVGRLRRRWPVLLCCVGALLGIATAASRTSIVIAIVSLASFALLSMTAGLRISRPIAGLLAVLALTGVVGWALVAADGSEIFARQETLAHIEPGQEKGGDSKEKHLSEIPRDLTHAPFGLGLGIAGSAGGFGGHEKVSIEEERVSGGSAYNLLAVEVGAPGLLLWLGLTLNVLALGLTRLRRIVDPELRIYLVAVLTSYVAFTVQGLVGTTIAVTPAGAYLWFAPGIIAFWLAGPGRSALAAWRPGMGRGIGTTDAATGTSAPAATTVGVGPGAGAGTAVARPVEG